MITNQTMAWVQKIIETQLKAIINLDGRDFEMKLPSGRVIHLIFEVSTNERACTPEYHRNTKKFRPLDEHDSCEDEIHPCETLANIRLKFVNRNDVDDLGARMIFQIMVQSHGALIFFNEICGTVTQESHDSEFLRHLGELYTDTLPFTVNAHFWTDYCYQGMSNANMNALLRRLFYGSEKFAEDSHGVAVFI